MSYVDQHTDPELYTLLVQVARHPRVGHEVYAAASDALGWTRAFSKAESAALVIMGEVEHSLIPMLKNCVDDLYDKHANIASSIGIIEARLAVIHDYSSYECQGRAA